MPIWKQYISKRGKGASLNHTAFVKLFFTCFGSLFNVLLFIVLKVSLIHIFYACCVIIIILIIITTISTAVIETSIMIKILMISIGSS